jgi:hypothetical protein
MRPLPFWGSAKKRRTKKTWTHAHEIITAHWNSDQYSTRSWLLRARSF